MKQILTLLALTALIAPGCSTGEKSATPAPDESSGPSYGGEDAETYDDSSPAAPPSKPKSSDYSRLIDAVKSNNSRAVDETSASILSKNPHDLIALNALATFHLKNKRTGVARLILKKALEKAPNNSALINNLALSYSLEGDETRAFQEWRRAASADSGNPIVAANIGAIHLKYRNYEEARRALEVAYNKSSNNITIGNNFALALQGVGDHSAARRVYERLVSGDGKSNQRVLLNYGILLVDHLNDRTKGQEIVNKIRFLATEPDIMRAVKRLEDRLK